MNIAVCFFGIVSNKYRFHEIKFKNEPYIDLNLVASHFKKYIIEPNLNENCIDIFIHSSTIKCSTELEQLYDPIKSEYKENTFKNDDDRKYAIKSRFYSQYRVNELRKEYCQECNIDYNLILLLRHDILFLKPLLFKDFNPDKFNISNSNTHSIAGGWTYPKNPKIQGIQDILFLSSQDNINKFCQIYLNLNEFIGNGKKETGHHICYQQLVKNNLTNNINGILNYHFDHILCRDLDTQLYPKNFVKYSKDTNTGYYEVIQQIKSKPSLLKDGAIKKVLFDKLSSIKKTQEKLIKDISELEKIIKNI